MTFITSQASFTAGELSPSLTARVDLSKYSQGCKTLKNMVVQPHGGAIKRSGFKLLDCLPVQTKDREIDVEKSAAVLVPFVFNKDQSYCLVFGEKWLRVARHNGLILTTDGTSVDDTPVHITSPYTIEQAQKFSYVQSADTLYIACEDVPPMKLLRLGHTSWKFQELKFTASLAAPTGLNTSVWDPPPAKDEIVIAKSFSYSYVVTAVDKDGKESNACAPVEAIGHASNNWKAGAYIEVGWQPVAGAVEYRLYKKEFGGSPGFIATTGTNVYRDINMRPLYSDGPPKWYNPFILDGVADYPSVVSFFEQRLVFASSKKRPQTIWMSRTGSYESFSISSPLKADDSIELTIASSEVSQICWIVALRSLILGSGGMEWEISSTEGAFTAKSAKVTPQSYRGSSRLRAMVIGNILLHITRSGREIRDLKYDFGADSYGGTDRTILAAHLFAQHRIVDWAYQPSPDSTLWALRDDGVLLGMTFQPEHEVYAWHQHHTQGAIKSICSVPTNQDDVVFVVVQRGDSFCLEVMAGQAVADDYKTFVYLDSALVYEGDAAKKIMGLEHLEGQEVGILADGAVQAPRTVTDGGIVLDAPAQYVVVGLPYVADLETMPVEVTGQDGTSVGRKKYINAVNILFKDTVTAKAGCSFSALESVKWRINEPYGAALKPYSGIHRIIVPNLAKTTATVCIRSDLPMPMTILALMPELDVK